MSESRKPGTAPEFDTEEGLSLALSYLEDPSSVPCPKCGDGQIEVVCYLHARSMEEGRVVPTSPDNDYTVVLYCHGCGRAAALDLSRDEQQERDAA
jgi:predicted RNA-binding Zn-ribbon protein involved in translation (DUF1610 family)